jgi:hypothetical protein
MQISKLLIPFKKVLFITVSAISLFIFITFTNQYDFIHGISFDKNELLMFPGKIMRIAPLGYAIGLMGSFTIAVLFSFCCISLGAFLIWHFVKNEAASEPLTFSAGAAIFCTAFLAGHALFSIIFILLGALHLFTLGFLFPLMLIGFIIGLPFARKMLALFPTPKNLELFEAYKRNDYKLMFIFAIAIVVFSLLYSSSRLSYDAVAFYFSDEKITALTNHIQFFQDNYFVASSFQTGISYAALIKFAGEQAARIYTWINGLVVIVFSLAIAEKVGLSKQARLIVLILLITSSAFLDLTGDGKVDIISTAAAMAAVYWAACNADKRLKSISILTGLLAGLAIASRPYNAFLVCAFIGIYYVSKTYSNKSFKPISLIKPALWIGLGISCLVISHLVMNWIILGDPLAMIKNLQAYNSPDKWHWTIPPSYLWIIRLLYPVSVTFINIPQSDGNISPLFICTLTGMLLGIIKIKLEKPLGLITLASLITLVVWLCLIFTVFEIRYVLFLWVLLFMPIANGIENLLAGEDLLLKRFAQSMLVLLLFFSAIRTTFISIDTYSPADKSGNSHCDDYAYCDLLIPINNLAPIGTRVLTLSAYRYYLRSDLFLCSSKHEEYDILKNLSLQDKNAFWLEVYRQGYKYIAYEKNYTSVHLKLGVEPGPDETPAWMKLEPIYGKPGDDVVSYKIEINNPPIKVEQMCAKNESGIWEVQPFSDLQN